MIILNKSYIIEMKLSLKRRLLERAMNTLLYVVHLSEQDG